MRIFRKLLVFASHHKVALSLAFVSMLFNVGAGLVAPRLVGNAVDAVLAGRGLSYLILVGAAIVVASTLRGLFAFGERYGGEYVSQKIAYDLRNAYYDKLQHLSFAFHDQQQTGQLMSRATVDVEAVRMFISQSLLRLPYLAILVSAILALLFSINWQLALVTLFTVPILISRSIHMHSRLRLSWQNVQQRMGEMTTLLQEALSGIRVVKAFGTEDIEEGKFDAKANRVADETFGTSLLQASNSALMNMVFGAAIGFTLWFGGWQVIRGSITPGELTQFILYINMLIMPVRMAGFLISNISRAISSGERIFQIIEADSPVRDAPGARPLTSIEGRVKFEDVSFAYNSSTPTLSDISFEVAPKQVVALLGPTGSGKTTIAHLLPRFYDVTSGAVFIDGVDTRSITLASLRQHIGIVQQDIFLFSATVRDNIAYGSPEATESQVQEAAKQAQLHDFIIGLPQGYNTWVGERGITLSGGQRQRVAIARTLLLNPPILILDDSTSSVDTETEHLIQQALAQVIHGRTTFIIAQRLSSVLRANLILVLKEGRIMERGTHQELLQQGGLYKEIYELQLRPQEEAYLATKTTRMR
ncbi:MAG: ABC transporter ATP-binding protein [Chloroflexi bacterium]|nr:ABC transporter ATP-binding protein [Chloroflexota bacterium]